MLQLEDQSEWSWKVVSMWDESSDEHADMKHVVRVAIHLYLVDQLNGFSGSSLPFQSTISLLSSESCPD